jgi:cell wall-associated NlpC family hydrolase
MTYTGCNLSSSLYFHQCYAHYGENFLYSYTVMLIKPKYVLATAMLFLWSTQVSFAQKKGRGSHGASTEVTFIDDIEINAGPGPVASGNVKKAIPQNGNNRTVASYVENEIEKAGALEIKYAILLNTEVESVHNAKLFQLIDEWFGTAYRLGGTDKKGIDCSAFMQVLSMGAFGITLPRTSREQYNFVNSIDPSELKEGDLVFFSSGGSISHVGFYLQNNKFVHASTSEGVTISDLGDNYWSKRFSGAGRINTASLVQTSSKP